MGDKKKASHAKCLLCDQLAKFGKQKNGQTGNNQEIIEVGRSKVTKASDSIAF